MSETATSTEIEIIPGTELVNYKDISKEIIAYEKADSDEKKTIEELIAQIDVEDRSTILFF